MVGLRGPSLDPKEVLGCRWNVSRPHSPALANRTTVIQEIFALSTLATGYVCPPTESNTLAVLLVLVYDVVTSFLTAQARRGCSERTSKPVLAHTRSAGQVKRFFLARHARDLKWSLIF